jgi:hypothetical protein
MNHLDPISAALLQYNHAVLEQTADVIAQHTAFSSPYTAHIGPHVRHILEHYQTLRRVLANASHAQAPIVDYDNRARDIRIEADPVFALGQLRVLQQWLLSPHWRNGHLTQAVAVQLSGGLQGEFTFTGQSSVARELTFLSSHAVHHFAVLQGYARQEGKSFGAGLGRAPATVAHENQSTAEAVTA